MRQFLQNYPYICGPKECHFRTHHPSLFKTFFKISKVEIFLSPRTFPETSQYFLESQQNIVRISLSFQYFSKIMAQMLLRNFFQGIIICFKISSKISVNSFIIISFEISAPIAKITTFFVFYLDYCNPPPPRYSLRRIYPHRAYYVHFRTSSCNRTIFKTIKC